MSVKRTRFIDLDPGERVWLDHAVGWLVLDAVCPRCGARITYNGNYACEWFYGGCGWALPHPARSKTDRAVCDALGIAYA